MARSHVCAIYCGIFCLALHPQFLLTEGVPAIDNQTATFNNSADIIIASSCLCSNHTKIKQNCENALFKSNYTNFRIGVEITCAGCDPEQPIKPILDRLSESSAGGQSVILVSEDNLKWDGAASFSSVILINPRNSGNLLPKYSMVDEEITKKCYDDWYIKAAIACAEYFKSITFLVTSSNEPRWKTLAENIEIELQRKNNIALFPFESAPNSSSWDPVYSNKTIEGVFVCAAVQSANWIDLIDSLIKESENSSTNTAIFIFQETISPLKTPISLPNTTSLTFFMISSTDYLNKMVDFPAFRYQSEEEGMEIFIHSSLLSAALLNMPLHANATGIFKTSITPSALEENIIEINIGKQFSTQYFIQKMGNIDYSLIRYLQFCVFQWLPEQQIYTKTLVDVSNDSDVSYGTRRPIRFQQVNPIIWPSDSRTQYVIPIFGMNSNSSAYRDCPCTYIIERTIMYLLGGLLVSGSFILLFRWWLRKQREVKGPNKILFSSQEIYLPKLLDAVSVSSASSSQPLRRLRSPPLASVASYNGERIHLRFFPVSSSDSFEIKRKTIEVLSSLRSLRHENVNNLWGCLYHSSRPALIYDYCSRGSLHEIIHRQELSLDWLFRLSLLSDLVKGMRYLHSENPRRFHGRLTSFNCVIDARWVLKITDYSLSSIYQAQGLEMMLKRESKALLWTAPEHLRSGSPTDGSQPGDVYSFAIVIQEVITGEEPFSNFHLEPHEILTKLRSPPPLIRPSVSKGTPYPELTDLMRQCWAESPTIRPNFNTIYDIFKKFNKGKKVNIVDHMNEMLEHYSSNLEDLIKARTEELDAERKKTDQLLNRMLPISVIEKLKSSQLVDPEEFDEVTIYFSDIVGFTALSAESTPMEVVNLLNDLYTCFDAIIDSFDVYKVETIGDAYMVVSGLPIRNGNLHAREIARMSLRLLEAVLHFRIRHRPDAQLKLRIGIHSGPCVAGVVGLKMPRFCLFGDTVNTASRMESNGLPLKIHVSPQTKDLLETFGTFLLELRGGVEMKGKGVVTTYWLLGEKKMDL